MARQEYRTTAYTDLDDFVYGTAKHPVKLKNGMVIGGGLLYPELNFTLPTMKLNDDTWPEAIEHQGDHHENMRTRQGVGSPGFRRRNRDAPRHDLQAAMVRRCL
jgi:hypothetical protein